MCVHALVHTDDFVALYITVAVVGQCSVRRIVMTRWLLIIESLLTDSGNVQFVLLKKQIKIDG